MSTQTVQVLLVEDDPGDARRICGLLNESTVPRFEVRLVTRLLAALEEQHRRSCDVLLLNLDLPDCRGLETFVSASLAVPGVPIVVLTGQEDDPIALEAVRVGSQDVVNKRAVDGPSLARIVRYAIERARADQQLARSEARYRSLVEATSSVVWIVAPGGWMIEPQHSWAALTGTTWGDAQQLGWLDSIHEADRDGLLRKLSEARSRSEAYQLECRIWHARSKRHRYYQIRAAPVFDAEGALVEWMATGQDIDPQKRADLEREELAAQLRQSQRMEAVGQLAGGVAHDFNNLLTAIGGNVMLMRSETGLSPSMSESIQEVEDATRRATALTRQLLAFSRRQVIQPRPLDLNLVVDDMERMLRRLIGEDIVLDVQCDSNLGKIRADPTQLEQIVLNLAVNARDAMPQGGRLSIRTRNLVLREGQAHRLLSERPGPYVELLVVDTGCGIDAETREHVFEPFFTTKARGKGTGLGLATVYGIVKQADGIITVESSPGKGAAFRIRFPRVYTKREATGIYDRPVTREVRGTETILVCEDEDAVRKLIARVLQQYGYTVLTAECGQEAVDHVRRHDGPIHLLLTDVIMPGMSGRTTAEKISKIMPEISTLYMSGYTDDRIVHRGVKTEKTRFLHKPFSPDELMARVREELDLASALTAEG